MYVLAKAEYFFSEDHLVKTQTMRGSPYFKPFEKEVLGWESQLIRKVQILMKI